MDIWLPPAIAVVVALALCALTALAVAGSVKRHLETRLSLLGVDLTEVVSEHTAGRAAEIRVALIAEAVTTRELIGAECAAVRTPLLTVVEQTRPKPPSRNSKAGREAATPTAAKPLAAVPQTEPAAKGSAKAAPRRTSRARTS